MMNPFTFLPLLALASACVWSVFYLFRTFRQERRLISLLALFCMAMGVFLLLLDLVLITLIHGAQYIPDYLLFRRLVADTGFAGRWVLTVYLFVSTALGISIYLLARNMLTKFNKKKNDKNL
jgi:hypothetical protein